MFVTLLTQHFFGSLLLRTLTLNKVLFRKMFITTKNPTKGKRLKYYGKYIGQNTR